MLATREYEKYVKFLVENNFSSDKIYHSAFTINAAVFTPTIIVLPDVPHMPEILDLVSRNQRNPNVAVIDYAIAPWQAAASFTLDEVEYTTLYSRIKEERITHSARITPDYKIKVSFPTAHTAFLLQFNL